MGDPSPILFVKNMKPKLYIIPGWGEKITGKNYQDLIESITGHYKVVPIKLNLVNKKYVFGETQLFSKVVEKARDQIQGSPAKDMILGFSVGASVAYELATQIKFRLAIICSISPIFGKDLSSLPPEKVSDLTSAQFEELTAMNYRAPLSPIVLFYGSSEPVEVIKRSKKLHRDFGGTLISIPNGQHKLHGNYLVAVKIELNRLGG
mgnify:CR=1 FL=1